MNTLDITADQWANRQFAGLTGADRGAAIRDARMMGTLREYTTAKRIDLLLNGDVVATIHARRFTTFSGCNNEVVEYMAATGVKANEWRAMKGDRCIGGEKW